MYPALGDLTVQVDAPQSRTGASQHHYTLALDNASLHKHVLQHRVYPKVHTRDVTHSCQLHLLER